MGHPFEEVMEKPDGLSRQKREVQGRIKVNLYGSPHWGKMKNPKKKKGGKEKERDIRKWWVKPYPSINRRAGRGKEYSLSYHQSEIYTRKSVGKLPNGNFYNVRSREKERNLHRVKHLQTQPAPSGFDS